MDRGDPPAVEALIVALPETAGSALYGMLDVLAATGTLWQQLVGEEPAGTAIRPRIVALAREPFRCGNGIPVIPDAGVEEDPAGDVVILPELWLRRCWSGFGAGIVPATRSIRPARARSCSLRPVFWTDARRHPTGVIRTCSVPASPMSGFVQSRTSSLPIERAGS
jgi:hypothetical protein